MLTKDYTQCVNTFWQLYFSDMLAIKYLLRNAGNLNFRNASNANSKNAGNYNFRDASNYKFQNAGSSTFSSC